MAEEPFDKRNLNQKSAKQLIPSMKHADVRILPDIKQKNNLVAKNKLSTVMLPSG